MVLWVFGYGSLIWKVGFSYDERVVGYIKGYKRVFYQGSTNHRGTPQHPGRTLTLEPLEDAICWGAAYRVSGRENEQRVLSYLEVREKNHDLRAYLDVYMDSSSTEPAVSGALVFIATKDKNKNMNYLGAAPSEEMAIQIAEAVGPSGPNFEYLFRLEEALIEIGHPDEDVINLANKVRKYLASSNEESFANCTHKL
ncbi:hypothetical protein O6H91_24G002300 [Diphasiastrum complanatum]|uniref:Uncharacterized protein n=1 Tax=Diphasiastrum complanatum TaxID=34168 RepID=A0ACC2A768_DIPCM|nr:hypothetical protein O6H91_24G002300 [Diphasiastrum complanatum]